MPVERISRGFKDISMSFQINPINSDTIAVKNEPAISRSIRNLVLTNPGERFFNPKLGSRISVILFDNADDISAAALREEIEETISVYEPRGQYQILVKKMELIYWNKLKKYWNKKDIQQR